MFNNKMYLPSFLIISFILISYGSYTDYILSENSPISNLGIFITFAASITGITCVVLVAKESLYNYLFGIISVSLWLIYVAFWSPLIWDAVMNIVYIILNLYGLYYWKHYAKKETKTSVAKTRVLRKIEYFSYTIIWLVLVVFFTLVGLKFGRYENPTQVAGDSATTTFALLGQWLMAKKVLESWYMWIAVNIISIPLYISIESYTLTAVWVMYLVNSIYGLYMWKKNMPRKNNILSS